MHMGAPIDFHLSALAAGPKNLFLRSHPEVAFFDDLDVAQFVPGNMIYQGTNGSLVTNSPVSVNDASFIQETLSR